MCPSTLYHYSWSTRSLSQSAHCSSLSLTFNRPSSICSSPSCSAKSLVSVSSTIDCSRRRRGSMRKSKICMVNTRPPSTSKARLRPARVQPISSLVSSHLKFLLQKRLPVSKSISLAPTLAILGQNREAIKSIGSDG